MYVCSIKSPRLSYMQSYSESYVQTVSIMTLDLPAGHKADRASRKITHPRDLSHGQQQFNLNPCKHLDSKENSRTALEKKCRPLQDSPARALR